MKVVLWFLMMFMPLLANASSEMCIRDRDGITPTFFLVMPNIAIAYKQSMTFITPVDASATEIQQLSLIHIWSNSPPLKEAGSNAFTMSPTRWVELCLLYTSGITRKKVGVIPSLSSHSLMLADGTQMCIRDRQQCDYQHRFSIS